MNKAEVSSLSGWMDGEIPFVQRSGLHLALMPALKPEQTWLIGRADAHGSLGICNSACSRQPLPVC